MLLHYLLILSLIFISCDQIKEKDSTAKSPEIVPDQVVSPVIETPEDDTEWVERGEYLAKVAKLKQKYIGHYHGINAEEESVYIELTPYIYKLYDFNGFMKLEDFRNPIIGAWGINPKNPQLIHLDLRSPGTEIISELHIAIKENGDLFFIPDQIDLEFVEANFVPMLYHFHRNVVEEKASVSTHDSRGILNIEHDYPDYKEIVNQEAFDLTQRGFSYQTGSIYSSENVDVIEDIPVDLETAAKLYEKAAIMGYPPAMYNLANMYYYDEWAFEQDLPKCVEWLTAAANLGHTGSEQLLGEILYFGGEGVEPNQEHAMELWLSAAKKGNSEAQYQYGDILLGKDGATSEELKEGEMWIRSAAGRDHPDAFFALFGLTYDIAEKYENSALYEEAGFFLMQSLYLGSEIAQNYYNKIMDNQNK